MENYLPLPFIITAFALLGAVFGSFITMASYRIPLGQDIIFKSSSCPICRHKLGFLDLFPVFSWGFNKGRCRHCKTKISARYPLIEIVNSFLFCVVAFKFGLALNSLIVCFLTIILMICSIIELEGNKITNGFYYILAAVGLIFQINESGFLLQNQILPIVLCFSFSIFIKYLTTFIFKKEIFHLGHVKLSVVSGIFIPISQLHVFFLILVFLAVFLCFIFKKSQLPFASILAISLFVCIINI